MRDIIKMTDEEIEEAFEELGCNVCVSEEYGCDVVFTRDTLDDFLQAAKNYNEHGSITRDGDTLIIESAQPRKGDRREDLYVIDFGEVRGCYR